MHLIVYIKNIQRTQKIIQQFKKITMSCIWFVFFTNLKGIKTIISSQYINLFEI